jgi:hypothetical protein
VIETAGGKVLEIGPRTYEVTARGGKGRALSKKRSVVKLVPPPVQVTTFTPTEVN